jgi:hypothetical protein
VDTIARVKSGEILLEIPAINYGDSREISHLSKDWSPAMRRRKSLENEALIEVRFFLLYMYVYVYIYLHICTHVKRYIYLCIYVCICEEEKFRK